ncbi:MAG: glycosyltransferase family 2 protein [Gemmataceae bacterium]
MTHDANRPAAKGQPLTVMVPIRNFAGGIRQFLDAWSKALSAETSEFEVIVIDDASEDGTAEVVREYSAKHAYVSLIQHETPQGLGAAVRSGFAVSRHGLILIVSPDWPYRPSDLPAMVEAMKGADVVSPFRPGIVRPRWQQSLLRFARVLARIIVGVEWPSQSAWYGGKDFRRRFGWRVWFGLRLQDPTCGVRLLRRWVLERCPIQSDSSFALIEMYAKANFAGALFNEVALGRAGNIPVMHGPFAVNPSDEKRVFRSPEFHPALATESKTG